MIRRNYLVAGLMVVLGVLASCQKKSDSGLSSTPSGSSSLAFQIQAINKSFLVGAVLDSLGHKVSSDSALNSGTFTWDTCRMNISRIIFEAEQHKVGSKKDSIEITIEWTGPRSVDLFNLNDLVGQIPLPPGTYSEIAINVRSVRGDFGTSPVFYLTGVYTTPAGIKTPLRIILNENLSFNAEKSGTVLDATNSFTDLVMMNLSILMSHIRQSDLDKATLRNGTLIISSTSNVNLYNKIRFDFDRCRRFEFHRR